MSRIKEIMQHLYDLLQEEVEVEQEYSKYTTKVLAIRKRCADARVALLKELKEEKAAAEHKMEQANY